MVTDDIPKYQEDITKGLETNSRDNKSARGVLIYIRTAYKHLEMCGDTDTVY